MKLIIAVLFSVSSLSNLFGCDDNDRTCRRATDVAEERC